jgi:four helix bundle protein
MTQRKPNVIVDKTFDFAVEVAELYKKLKIEREYNIANQLFRSAGSIGANVEEAQAAISKRDFIAKISIASKEARETRYWLRVLQAARLTEVDLELYLKKIEDIINILTKIIKTSQTGGTTNVSLGRS